LQQSRLENNPSFIWVIYKKLPIFFQNFTKFVLFFQFSFQLLSIGFFDGFFIDTFCE